MPAVPADVDIQTTRDLVQSRDIWRKAYESLRAQFQKVVDWYKTPVVEKP